jgi:hypothetical protein
MSQELIQYSFDDVERMAQAVAKSGLFDIKNPSEAMALMLLSQAEGIHPMKAARDYHIIKGRPALKADAILARHQSSGGSVIWDKYTDEEVTGTFSHPSGGTVKITWNIEKAKKAGLYRADSGWTKFPAPMMRARCVSEGVRAVNPGCIVGIYTPEEISDFDDKPSKKSYKDVTPKPDVIENTVIIDENPPHIPNAFDSSKIRGEYQWKIEIAQGVEELANIMADIATTKQYLTKEDVDCLRVECSKKKKEFEGVVKDAIKNITDSFVME